MKCPEQILASTTALKSGAVPTPGQCYVLRDTTSGGQTAATGSTDLGSTELWVGALGAAPTRHVFPERFSPSRSRMAPDTSLRAEH